MDIKTNYGGTVVTARFHEFTVIKLNSNIQDSDIVLLMMHLENRVCFENLANWLNVLKDAKCINKIYLVGNSPLNSQNICTKEKEIMDLLDKAKKKYGISYEYSEFCVKSEQEVNNFMNKLINSLIEDEKRRRKLNRGGVSCVVF